MAKPEAPGAAHEGRAPVTRREAYGAHEDEGRRAHNAAALEWKIPPSPPE